MRFSFDKGVNGVGNVHRREYLGEIVRASRPANGMKQARRGFARRGAALCGTPSHAPPSRRF